MERLTKYSRKREEIMKTVCESKAHPTAEWIYNKLKPGIPDLSLGTVYRNLTLLKSEGLIISVGTVAGKERFDGCVRPHTHFVCDKCGKVIDIDGLDELEMPEHYGDIGRKAGVEIDGCTVLYHGKCKDCR